jgi:hypothetical protein
LADEAGEVPVEERGGAQRATGPGLR